MSLEEFMDAMDVEAPEWFINLADERDLKDFVRGNQIATKKLSELRRRTGNRLFICARATHQGLLNMSTKS